MDVEQLGGVYQTRTYYLWEVLGLAVALGHSSVLVPEHGRDGATNDIASAKNDGT
jgi:hypothetical protein